jgi:co-chaperonin GroES (HSP10)
MIRAIEMLSQAQDQKSALMEVVGDLSKIELLNNTVLVGIYIEPEKTKGGIILSANVVKESVWQGTAGLVLAKENTAFKDEPETGTFFHGQDVEVNDWVVFRPGDARRVRINGVDCRMVEDTLLDMVIESPDVITHR